MPSAARSVALVCLALAVLAPAMADPAGDAAFDLAAGTIRCDCGCHPQSVKDCACGRGAEMRDEVRALLAGGLSGQQVIDHYVARHGEQIRLSPTATGFNLVAWVGPLVGLVLASLALVAVLRRWRRAAPPERPAPATGPLPDGEWDERLRRALEHME